MVLHNCKSLCSDIDMLMHTILFHCFLAPNTDLSMFRQLQKAICTTISHCVKSCFTISPILDLDRNVQKSNSFEIQQFRNSKCKMNRIQSNCEFGMCIAHRIYRSWLPIHYDYCDELLCICTFVVAVAVVVTVCSAAVDVVNNILQL